MPDPPELAYETATPQQLLQRLEILRERFRTGVLSAADFNTAIKAFQFSDEIGHLWAPGATTGRWYRWDQTEWTAADPPPRLRVPQSPLLFTDFEDQEPADAQAPAPKVCTTCGEPDVGRKFCTSCGTKLGTA